MAEKGWTVIPVSKETEKLLLNLRKELMEDLGIELSFNKLIQYLIKNYEKKKYRKPF